MVSGLGKTVVETTLAATGYVDPGAFKDHSLRLIHVETLPQHVNDEAPGLRNAKDVGGVHSGLPAVTFAHGKRAPRAETIDTVKMEK